QNYQTLLNLDQQIAEIQEISGGSDLVLRDLAYEEIERLKGQQEAVMSRVKVALLPKDSLSPKNAIVTVQPETEGDKAASFADTLWHMYSRYASARGWIIERLTSLEDFHHITFVVRGKGAYGRLKYEEGMHAFQPAPVRPSGRSSLFTARVTVLPE